MSPEPHPDSLPLTNPEGRPGPTEAERDDYARRWQQFCALTDNPLTVDPRAALAELIDEGKTLQSALDRQDSTALDRQDEQEPDEDDITPDELRPGDEIDIDLLGPTRKGIIVEEVKRDPRYVNIIGADERTVSYRPSSPHVRLRRIRRAEDSR